MPHKPDLDARVTRPARRRFIRWLRFLTWSLLAATLTGRLGTTFFVFELFSHFAVQYAVLAALLLVLWLYVRSRALVVVSVSSLLINCIVIRPWLVVKESGVVSGQHTVRVMHANVLFTGNDYSRIVRLVQSQSPDLFVLQEMTPESIRGVSALKQTFPYQYHIWAKGPCHILAGSRTPIRVDPSAIGEARVIWLTTVVRGHTLALLTVHPQTPMLPSWFANRNRQLAFIAAAARRERRPTVVLGDFNISVFSPVYHHIFQGPFTTYLTACRRGFGLQPTWPRFLPPMFIPIDHAFVNKGFRTVNFQTVDQPGSDHKAIVVDLAFTDFLARP